jgi:hypothetical protein
MTIDLTGPNIDNFDEPRKRVAVIAASAGSLVPAGFPAWGAPGHEGAPDPRVASTLLLNPDQERMLTALERVFPVRFELSRDADLDEADGMLMLGPASLESTPAGLPRLVLPCHEPPSGSGVHNGVANASISSGDAPRVVLADGPDLARPLRGRTIPEHTIAGALPAIPAGATVLAQAANRPVWWQADEARATLGVSAYPLADLRDGEALSEKLRAGCFMGLLPLIHFLGQMLGDDGWKLPSPRASFIVDDPNLHWRSYGFLDYPELVAHATRHGYHVGFATVPLDGWRADRRAASLLAQNASALSLLVHGNDHIAEELGRLRDDAEAQAAIAQALRRIAALERRSGVSVDRVITPPHGACSEAALRAMYRLGLEAIAVTPPYPWRQGLPASTPLAAWHPAELVAGGLSVLPRYHLNEARDELALRALLGQPLILYGHHEDFAQGLDVLAQAASDINDLGDVRWGPLSWIARGSYATRRLGDTLLVRMHAPRIAVEVPAGVHSLRVLVPEPYGGAAGHRLTHVGGSAEVAFVDGLGSSQPLPVDGVSRIDLTLAADCPLIAAEVPSPAIRPWSPIRRALAEGRDRLRTLR